MNNEQRTISNHIKIYLLAIVFLSTIFISSTLGQTSTQAAPTESFTVEYSFDAEDLNPGDTHCDASLDPGDQCTLRAAIQETNSLAGAQEITVNPGTYILTGNPDEDDAASGDLDIKGDLTITGAMADNTIIDGNAIDRIFHITSDISVNIQNLTLRNGNLGHLESGGAILNEWGDLTIEGSKVLTNTATYGGGIMISGSTASGVLINCLVNDNRASYGGGILNSSDLSLVNSDVSANRINLNNVEGGGGIHNSGNMTISNSTITDNHNPYSDGGGIFSKSPGSVTIIDSTISENTTARFGGGIFIRANSLTVNGTTINNNLSSNLGGGLFILDTLSYLTNSTISSNRANGHGGGFYIDNNASNDQPIYLSSVTVMSNISNNDRTDGGSGGGIFIEPEFLQTVYVKNTVLAENLRRGTLFFVENDCDGVITSQDYNLIKATNDCTINGQTSHNLTGISPMLSPLGNYGGPTHTRIPLVGSPVIDAANPAGCRDGSDAILLSDQRGEPRHIDGNGDATAYCDIGAVELFPKIYLPIIVR